VDLMKDSQVLPGVLLGAVIPFVFAAITMLTLHQVSRSITQRVQAQGTADSMSLRETKVTWFIDQVVGAGTSASMWYLLIPASFAIGLTIIIGFAFGPRVLIGFLAGAMVSGLIMSVTLVNTGAAMAFEEKDNIFGASLKDAGGPAINVLTKLVVIVAIVHSADKSWTFFLVLVISCITGLLLSFLSAVLRNRGETNNHVPLVSEETSFMQVNVDDSATGPAPGSDGGHHGGTFVGSTTATTEDYGEERDANAPLVEERL